MMKDSSFYSGMLRALADEIRSCDGCVTESAKNVEEAADRIDRIKIKCDGMAAELMNDGSHKLNVAKCLEDLLAAVETFHGPIGWEIYQSEAPEMKRARTLLAKVSIQSTALFYSITEDKSLSDVIREVGRAAVKFPTWPTDPLHAVAVLGEEFGELTKATLQSVYEPHKSNLSDVREEAVQTAAMAIRFLMSLDKYKFSRCEQHAQFEGENT